MFIRATLGLSLLTLHAVVTPVHAAIYYDNISIRGNSIPYQQLPSLPPPQTYPSATARYTPTPTYIPVARPVQPVSNVQQQYSNGTCLYSNAQGECMIEQYYDPRTPTYDNRDRFRTNTVYDRSYLYNERKYSNRDDDDDHYDYRYFRDDDDDWDDDDDFFDDDDDFFDDDDDDCDDCDDCDDDD